MATTTITVAAFQNACAECADAIAATNWGTATSWYARAEAINAGLDVEASVGGSNTGEHKTRRRETLKGLREAITAAKLEVEAANVGSGFVTTRTNFGS